MTRYIGIDPDLHHAGVAIIEKDQRRPTYLGVLRVPSKFKGIDAVAQLPNAVRAAGLTKGFAGPGWFEARLIAESQEIYAHGRHKRPNDIVHLGQAAGTIMGCLSMCNESFIPEMVDPKNWKGQTDKESHQRILGDHLRWRYSGMELKEIAEMWDIKPSELTHVLDAFGVASWGLIRDELPRAPDRPEGASVEGKIVSLDRLIRVESRFGVRKPASL